MNDLEIIDIIRNKKELNNEELNELLYRLFESGDYALDTLRNYTRIGDCYYFDKMIDVLNCICRKTDGWFKIFNPDFTVTDDIHDMVDMLGPDMLIEFIKGTWLNSIVLVDFEGQDKVYRSDSLMDVYTKHLESIILDEDIIIQGDIDDIIEFIYNLDLFDVEMIR